MGGSSALYLHRAGVRVVGIADARGLVHNPGRGLDVPALLAGRRPGGLIDRAALRPDDVELPAPPSVRSGDRLIDRFADNAPVNGATVVAEVTAPSGARSATSSVGAMARPPLRCSTPLPGTRPARA